MNSASAHPYQLAFADVSSRLPGNAGVANMRANALSAFSEQGIPTIRDEHWKYTNLRALSKRPVSPALEAETIDLTCLKDKLIPELGIEPILFINGVLNQPTTDLSDDTLIIDSLTNALNVAPAPLGPLVDFSRHRFAALNHAFSADGLLLKSIAKQARKKPVYLVFLSTGNEAIASHPRLLIDAAEQSELIVIEHHIGLGDVSAFNNVSTEIRCAEGAHVEHYSLQMESNKTIHLAGIHVQQAANSRFVSHNINLGAQLARHDLHIRLEGSGAETIMNGLSMVDGRQHQDNHTVVEHVAPHTCSDEFYKGVLSGHGRSVFNGKVHVHQDAQKTDASQANDNLLLSDSAEIDTKPELEIYADDVKCAHGATVGRIDEQALFYLQSRGLSAEAAHAMMVYAFAESVVERGSILAVRSYLEQYVGRKLAEATS